MGDQVSLAEFFFSGKTMKFRQASGLGPQGGIQRTAQ